MWTFNQSKHIPRCQLTRKINKLALAFSCLPPCLIPLRMSQELSLEGAWVPHGPSWCVSGPEACRAVFPLWQHKSKCQWKDSRVTTTTMRVGKRWMEDNRHHHHGDCCRLIVVFVFFLLWGCSATRSRSRERKYSWYWNRVLFYTKRNYY